MTQESISKKLAELFELFESGGLSKEEYDLLKSQLINIEVRQKPKEVGESIQEESIPESTIKPGRGDQNTENRFEVGLEDTEEEKKSEKKSIKRTDKPTESKKGNGVLIISIIALVSILTAILIFRTSLFSKKTKIVTQEEQTVTDIDGNKYNTVKIGSQVWMLENLRTTKYNDGTPIPLVPDNSTWRALTTPAYCWYDNDEMKYKETYGALYNWYTINSDKLCPQGWHVPTATDWKILTTYLTNYGYGYQDSGDDIAKSLAGTHGWDSSSETGAVGNDLLSNNRSGFTAFASGIRFSNGEFRHSGQNSKWWSSTETSPTKAQIRFIGWEDGIVTSYSNRKENGFSVRCVRNSSESELTSDSKAKNSDKQDENNSINAQADIEASQSSNDKNSKSIRFISARWDEDFVSKIIVNDLSENPSEWPEDYQYYFSDEDEFAEISHVVPSYIDVTQGEKKYRIGIAVSTIYSCPPRCGGPIFSIYEFQQLQDGWNLTRKAIGIQSFRYSNHFEDIVFYPLTSDDYAIRLEGHITGSRGEPSEYTEVNVYAFMNGDLKRIFYTDNAYNDMNYKTFSYNNSMYLEVEKFTNDVAHKEYYKFTGDKYEEYNGSFTAPSLTSLERMGLYENMQAKEKGICPTCNGTGTQICPLCGGTGVTNMGEGFECSCVRAYKTELAAGHTPSHPPLKWTCTRCGGTGNY